MIRVMTLLAIFFKNSIFKKNNLNIYERILTKAVCEKYYMKAKHGVFVYPGNMRDS